MLFVHFLRLLHAFQTNIRRKINTCWQSLARKHKQFHNDGQKANTGFQLETRGEMMRWAAHYNNLIGPHLQVPFTESRSLCCQMQQRDIVCLVSERQFPKWRFYLFKSIKREKTSPGARSCLLAALTVPHVVKLRSAGNKGWNVPQDVVEDSESWNSSSDFRLHIVSTCISNNTLLLTTIFPWSVCVLSFE